MWLLTDWLAAKNKNLQINKFRNINADISIKTEIKKIIFKSNK